MYNNNIYIIDINIQLMFVSHLEWCLEYSKHYIIFSLKWNKSINTFSVKHAYNTEHWEQRANEYTQAKK